MGDDIYNFSKTLAKSANPIANIAMGVGSAIYNDIAQNQQFNRNLELWKMQAEYNKPINQMKRLKEAGLNPLFYGLDGNSTSAPQPAPTPPTDNPFNSMLIAKQMQEMDGNIAMQRASADKTSAEAEAQRISNEYLRNKLEDEQTSRHFQATYDAFRHQWFFNTPVDPNKSSFSQEDTHAWKTFEKDFSQLRSEMAKNQYDEKFWNDKKQFVMREITNYIDSLDYETTQKHWLAKQAEQMYNNLVTQGEQQTLDFNLDKENKDFTQKMGIFGRLVELLLKALGR